MDICLYQGLELKGENPKSIPRKNETESNKMLRITGLTAVFFPFKGVIPKEILGVFYEKSPITLLKNNPHEKRSK